MKNNKNNEQEHTPKQRKIKTIINLFKNKKSRSWIILGAYGIFFIILAVLFRINPTPKYTPPKESTTQSFEKMNNYEYILKFKINEQDNKIYGKVHQEKTEIIIDNQKYYIVNGNTYRQEEYLIINPLKNENYYKKLTPINLNKLINQKNLDSEKTIEDKTIKTYIIDLKEYTRTMMTEIDKAGIIKIEVTQQDKKTIKIEIKFDDVLEQLELEKLEISIEYFKEDKVINFDIPPFKPKEPETNQEENNELENNELENGDKE